jgi:hypothetical protein
MSLDCSVDAILQRLITDARNLKPTINVSQGTDTYIRFACAASAIYGLYKQRDWTLDQIFLTSMSRESLERYAADRGETTEGMTSAELLAYLLDNLRHPESGGKPSDFERWALQATSAGTAVALTASMLSSGFTDFSAATLLTVHDMDSVGFTAATGDESKTLVIDLGDSRDVIGVGLGTITDRAAVFNVSSADSLGGAWTSQGSITSSYWWARTTFSMTSARYWKLTLISMDALESWQIESYNLCKFYGLEVYVESDSTERATSARCLANYYGPGTVMMRLLPATLSRKLCEAVRAKCEAEGPVAPREIYVAVPQETTLALKVTLTGSLTSELSFRTEIAQYFASLDAGDYFIPAQVIVFALKYGADNATVQVSKNGGAFADADNAIKAGDMEIFLEGEVTVE